MEIEDEFAWTEETPEARAEREFRELAAIAYGRSSKIWPPRASGSARKRIEELIARLPERSK